MTGYDVITISEVPFDFLQTRRQLFARMHAERGNRVLYVEPPNSIYDKFAFAEKKPRVGFFPRLTYRDGIWVLSPVMKLPFAGRLHAAGIPAIRRVNAALLRRSIEYGIRRLNFRDYLVWYYSGTVLTRRLLRELNGRVYVYECTDNLLQSPGMPRGLARELFSDLCQSADVITATARQLEEVLRPHNEKVLYCGNGVDVRAFDPSRAAATRPADVADIAGPVVGYVGVVYDQIHYDLLKYAARQRPKWTFVHIGPYRIAGDYFADCPNVRLLHFKPKAELPAYISGFDAAVCLFRQNDFTRMVNPLKVYEYLAMGVPVVSTPMAEIEHLSEVVRFEREPERFVSALERAMAERHDPQLQAKRVAFARSHSFDAIYDRITETVARRLA